MAEERLSERRTRSGGRRGRGGVVAAIAVACVAVGLVLVTGFAGLGPPAVVQQTATPRAGGERFAGATVHRSDGTIVAVPDHPNGRLAVYVHGASQTAASALTNATTSSITAALLRAGYVVAAANAGGNAWGDAASVRTYTQLITTTTLRYDLPRVYLYAESMGGLAGAQLAREEDVEAWVGIFPVCDLSTLVDPVLRGQLSTVYPLGLPATLSPVAWPRKPVKVWASDGDTVVPAATNGRACAATVGGTFTPTHGDHGDPSNYDSRAVVSFFDAH